METSKYGGWLTEDLQDYCNELIEYRDHSEEYSDRKQTNQTILEILGELQERERNS